MNILIVLFALISFDSFACKFRDKTDIENFSAAKKIFRAKIVATELTTEIHDGKKRDVVLVTYSLIESYKGVLPGNGIVKEFPYSSGNCMLGLRTGKEYVIYTSEYDFVNRTNGSWGYSNPNGTAVLPKLETLRELAKVGI